MSSNKSRVWEHFTKKGKNEATCNFCQIIIQRQGANTTGMINHLKVHSIFLQKKKCDEIYEASSSKKPKTGAMLNFVGRESLNEILAKCAAKDGFSIRGITFSEAIRGFVRSRNYEMPKSETTVMKNIMKFYEEKKSELSFFLNKKNPKKNSVLP